MRLGSVSSCKMSASAEEQLCCNAGTDRKELIDEGKNAKWVVCKFCQSKVLKPTCAEFFKTEFFLPYMEKKENMSADKPAGENLTDHWLVRDMYTFENVGFSKTVSSIKYLTCADCEIGPIGWHDTRDHTKFYVSLDRVQHQ